MKSRLRVLRAEWEWCHKAKLIRQLSQCKGDQAWNAISTILH
jgi:hypothetical protein